MGQLQRPDKYPFIDALRGYAVLLVMTDHTSQTFPELPYRLKSICNYGWHGVQLFFLMSCVTLLLSWRSEEAKDRPSMRSFWSRRFFRIAPLYYVAAAFYFFLEPPTTGFDLGQFLASVAFINSWNPAWMPTVPHGWVVVPGGWSISVEFTFYALFPLIATHVRSMRGALSFCALAFLFGSVANPLARLALAGEYGEVATRNFLYFWFPNQLSAFALGTVLFYALRGIWAASEGATAVLFRRHANVVVSLCAGLCVIAANCPFPQELPFALPLVLPGFIVASLIFMVLSCALGNAPESIFNNRIVRAFGTVSFSAYILHFAVLYELPVLLPTIFDVKTTGWSAILTFVGLWIIVVPLTFGFSLLSYRAVEQPMIALGRHLLSTRRVSGAVPASADR